VLCGARKRDHGMDELAHGSGLAGGCRLRPGCNQRLTARCFAFAITTEYPDNQLASRRDEPPMVRTAMVVGKEAVRSRLLLAGWSRAAGDAAHAHDNETRTRQSDAGGCALLLPRTRSPVAIVLRAGGDDVCSLRVNPRTVTWSLHRSCRVFRLCHRAASQQSTCSGGSRRGLIP